MIGFSRSSGGRAVKTGVSLVDAPSMPLGGGRWGLSRIVAAPTAWQPAVPGAWQTAAHAQGLAPSIQAFYPPLNAAKTAYVGAFALVRLGGAVGVPNADTQLFPALAPSETLGANLAGVLSVMQGGLTAFRYTDRFRSVVGKSGFTGAGYTAATLFQDVIRDAYRFLEHSTARVPKISEPESHNTEYLDSFATDPYSAPRWTNRLESAVWDSGNSELDLSFAGANTLLEYTANTPGSIEQEAQVTCATSASERRIPGAAVRIDGATSDFYSFYGDHTASEVRFGKRSGGSFTVLSTGAFTFNTTGPFYSFRLAASGAAGANAALSAWLTEHAAGKPSDPGWLGVDASPDFTYTDTAADRLDDSVHDAAGIGCQTAINTDYDTRCCFWKSRAISDRAGGGPTTYNQSASGTLSTAGSLAKQAGKVTAGTVTTAGALLKRCAKIFIGTATTSGALTKRTAKTFAGTLSSSATLTAIKTALISLAATLTTAGALSKQTGKTTAGTLTTAGALARRTSRSLAATLTTAGALVKQPQRVLTGALSSVGALSRQAQKTTSGTLATSGALSRVVSKVLAGALAPVGALAKLTAKFFTAALSFLGTATGIANASEPQLLASEASLRVLPARRTIADAGERQTTKTIALRRTIQEAP